MSKSLLWMSDEVAAALAAGRPVVALESSLIAQGLPSPHNLETANASEAAVRDEGAVPATTAIDRGLLLVGAGPDVLERLADKRTSAAKAGSRDLAPVLASGAWPRPPSAPRCGSPRWPASGSWPPGASAACTAAPQRP